MFKSAHEVGEIIMVIGMHLLLGGCIIVHVIGVTDTDLGSIIAMLVVSYSTSVGHFLGQKKKADQEGGE